ncbi:uncharacterized protein TNCV_804261 [Trichonephila clavipes]|nr:uncharacterized protein TNCV_804261 [Trichonephila clavipes]
MDILKLNKAKSSLKGSITRIATFMDNVSEHVDITELEVKLKKIDHLQRKIEELKELLFGLETAKPTEEAEFEEDLYKCETCLDDLENTVLSSTASQHRKNVLISTGSVFFRNNEGRELKCPSFLTQRLTLILYPEKCDFLGIAIEKINSSVSGLDSLKQNLKGKTNTLISNKSGTFRENVEFFVTEKITGLTPSVTLDVSEMKIPEFLELSDPYFYEAKEINALLNGDIFFRIIKGNVYKVNKELLFRETEFGWIAG